MSAPKFCRPHLVGVAAGTPPFFYDWCSACQRKKVEGKVTGAEGPVRDPAAHHNQHVSRKQWNAVQAGRHRDRMGRLGPR